MNKEKYLPLAMASSLLHYFFSDSKWIVVNLYIQTIVLLDKAARIGEEYKRNKCLTNDIFDKSGIAIPFAWRRKGLVCLAYRSCAMLPKNGLPNQIA